MKIKPFISPYKYKVSYLIRRCLTEINAKDYTASQISFLCKEFTPSRVVERFASQSNFVAIQGDRILGCVTLKNDIIGSLFVNPLYNNQGVGSYLLSYIEELAMSRGIIKLWVNSSKTAVIFYKNKGYVVKEKRRHANAGITYIMYKKI